MVHDFGYNQIGSTAAGSWIRVGTDINAAAIEARVHHIGPGGRRSRDGKGSESEPHGLGHGQPGDGCHLEPNRGGTAGDRDLKRIGASGRWAKGIVGPVYGGAAYGI